MQTIKLPIPPENQDYEPFVRGDTFPAFEIEDDEPIAQVACQFRADELSAPVLEWSTDNGNASLSEDKLIAYFDAQPPAVTKLIRPGRYYGDIQVTYESGKVDTSDRMSLDVIGDITR